MASVLGRREGPLKSKFSGRQMRLFQNEEHCKFFLIDTAYLHLGVLGKGCTLARRLINFTLCRQGLLTAGAENKTKRNTPQGNNSDFETKWTLSPSQGPF